MTYSGPRPHAFDIVEATAGDETYRTVAWTGRYLQVTLGTRVTLPCSGCSDTRRRP